MYQLTAIYAHPADPEAFLEHYRSTHAPIAVKFPELRSFAWGVCEAPDGSKPPHFMIAVLRWDSKEDAMAALGSEPGKDAVADLANFAQAGVELELAELQVEV